MAKEKSKRMDWYKWFPRDIQTSRSYQRMSPTQRGAFRDLLDECWINFEKGCGIEVDSEWLANAWGAPDVRFQGGTAGVATWLREGCAKVEEGLAQICNIRSSTVWEKEMPGVLAKFRVENGRLVNDKLLEQVDETLEVIVNASIRGQGNRKSDTPEPAAATTVGLQSNYSSNPDGLQVDKKRREDKSREDEMRADVGVGGLLDEVTAEQSIAENGNGRKIGEPGFYRRGQYPGTSPKAVFSHIAKAWARIRGAAAVCRYPSKYPESWELLCDQKSGDLLVPAFELWATAHSYNTEWPLTEFIKVAQQFMEQVIPLKEIKPKLSAEEVTRINETSAKVRAEAWQALTPKASDEPGADDFISEVNS